MSKNNLTNYLIKILATALFILVILGLNYAIYDKNNVKKNGEIVYLQLRPVDPRSLMQGDYMALAYDLELKAKVDPNPAKPFIKTKYMVVDIDSNKIAQFNRLEDSKKDLKLTPNQKVMKIEVNQYRSMMKPNAFFFQEGHGPAYANAKYGIFRFKGPDVYILDGLADENRRSLPSPQSSPASGRGS